MQITPKEATLLAGIKNLKIDVALERKHFHSDFAYKCYLGMRSGNAAWATDMFLKKEISSETLFFIEENFEIPLASLFEKKVMEIYNSLISNCLYDEIISGIESVVKQVDTGFMEKDEALEKIINCIETPKPKQNITEKVQDWIMEHDATDCNISATDCNKECGFATMRNKSAVRMVFARLCKKGVIEPVKSRPGRYKLIDYTENEIDFINASIDPLILKFPFELEKLVKIYKKNIILIAGEPNSGKTTFLLNFAIMNVEHKIKYVSSEMGAEELKSRLINFEINLDAWKNIKFIERSSDFSNIIDPDGINIIDYMEIHEEHFKIGKWIKEVFDKLNTGIAVIAIQKKKGQNEGVGGMATLEKPRLYLAMEPGKLKIIKAKSFADHTINPNGSEIDFKLVKGAYFYNVSDWTKDGNILLKNPEPSWIDGGNNG